MGAIIPILLSIAPALIKGAEAIFSKPKSGTDKLNAVMQALQAFASQFVASGQAPPGTTVPEAPAIQALIETVLAQLKTGGGLTTPASGALYLVQGTVTPLKTQ